MKRSARIAAMGTALVLGFSLCGCERRMRDMYEQPRMDPGEASTLWPDGQASRLPPPGVLAFSMGDLAATSSGRQGRDEAQRHEAAEAAASLPPVTPALLARGRERYDVYCQPCHSPLGDGDGPVVRRGFPAPPSYHQPRLRSAADRHFYDVITQGYGIMAPYADHVAPEDRWAIVAYVRALQLSQNAPVAQLPRRLQDALRATPGARPLR